jgi:ureidoacrylate peracid hydrolase
MHVVDIPQHILNRVAERRGRVKAFDALDPATTAIIVVDMQSCFLTPGAAIEVATSRDIAPNINRLSSTLRAAGGQVVWTRHSFTREWTSWYGVLAKDEFAERMVEETVAGSSGHAIAPVMDVQDSDWVIDKRRYSALVPGDTDLGARLRERGIETVLITGTLTNVCCESTARDAMMRNYKTVFLSDGNATRSDEEHNATLTAMIQVVADVVTTDEAVALIDAGTGAGAPRAAVG